MGAPQDDQKGQPPTGFKDRTRLKIKLPFCMEVYEEAQGIQQDNWGASYW